MEYQIYFDENIIWKPSYHRNFKNKTSKNILCFPDHSIGGHFNTRFCGRPIIANTFCPTNTSVLICGAFGRADEFGNVYHIGDVVEEEKLKNNKRSEYKIFIGKEVIPYKKYEINSELKAWSMNDRLSKHSPQYLFVIYLFLKMKDKSKKYKCVSVAKSPPFNIYSSRQNRIINKLIKLENNCNIMSNEECEDENIFLESLEKLKKTINPNSFKYKKLMPHIYDSFKVLNKSYKNHVKKEEKSSALYSMESLINSLKEFSISEPNTVFKVNADPFSFEVRIVERIDKNREEITYNGMTMEEAIEELKKGFEYLDRCGNIRRIKPSPDDIGFPVYE